MQKQYRLVQKYILNDWMWIAEERKMLLFFWTAWDRIPGTMAHNQEDCEELLKKYTTVIYK